MKRFQGFAGKRTKKSEIQFILKLMHLDETIESFTHKFVTKEKFTDLYISIAFKKIIKEITFISNIDINYSPIKKMIPMVEGEWFDTNKLKETYEVIKGFYKDVGYKNIDLEHEVLTDTDNIQLVFRIKASGVVKVKGVDIIYEDSVPILKLETKFASLKGKVWDKLAFKVAINHFSKEIFNAGFFFSKVDLMPPKALDDTNIILRLKVFFGQKINIYLSGHTIFSRLELLDTIKKYLKSEADSFDQLEIKKLIERKYEEVGIYGTTIKTIKRHGRYKSKVQFNNYYLKVIEGKKRVMNVPLFSGNRSVPDKVLENSYFKNATTLAKNGFMDEKYLKYFMGTIKAEYLKRGFLFVKVSAAKELFQQDKKLYMMEYDIEEGHQVYINKLAVNNLPEILKDPVKKLFVNKQGQPFNVVNLQNDVKKLLHLLKERGHYFVKIKNLKKPSLVQYSKDNSGVDISIDLSDMKRAIFDGFTILGNVKTEDIVIKREIGLQKGESLTPKKVATLKNKIASLGLFSRVSVTPHIIDKESSLGPHQVNLFIQVKEADSRIFEIAPGYRTDIGIKLSAAYIVGNLSGMNRSFSIKAQTNQRLDLSNLDPERPTGKDKEFEYELNLNYIDPYIFGKSYSFNTTFSALRRRFYAFDANIFKFSAVTNKALGKFTSVSLKYQYEMIRQFSANDDQNNGNFRIGGLTPSIVFDLRDNKINPRKGMYFGLSLELANPWLASMDNEELEVNFLKFTSKNRFYIPIKNWVIAASLSIGYQKNLAGSMKLDSGEEFEHYIPNTKVFRLDGVDLVRGFEDSEINRLDSGLDISETKITGKAYFSNIKIEPRYYLDDNTVAGLFFDAGKLYVDKFRPLSLRTSVGVTYKVVTPVGTLNFDYGIKLERTAESGIKEGFGRFHISIGFF